MADKIPLLDAQIQFWNSRAHEQRSSSCEHCGQPCRGEPAPQQAVQIAASQEVHALSLQCPPPTVKWGGAGREVASLSKGAKA